MSIFGRRLAVYGLIGVLACGIGWLIAWHAPGPPRHHPYPRSRWEN